MATNGMTINGLNPLSALTADDKIPVWDTGASGEPTKEITAQNMANSVKSLASLPNTTEMNTAIEQSTAVEYNSFNAVAEFENFKNKIISDVTFISGGTAVADLPFSSNATMMIYGRNNIHVLCFRANGELYTRNKYNETWENGWTKRW